jgi:hypothetical protein
VIVVGGAEGFEATVVLLLHVLKNIKKALDRMIATHDLPDPTTSGPKLSLSLQEESPRKISVYYCVHIKSFILQTYWVEGATRAPKPTTLNIRCMAGHLAAVVEVIGPHEVASSSRGGLTSSTLFFLPLAPS